MFLQKYIILQVKENGNSYVSNAISYVEKMEKIMNEQADAGYRLHTVFSSEEVKTIRFDGNSCPKTTMIFEKIE